MGVHHAREWPSSEHTIEFAYDLLRNYGVDSRTTSLVQQTRTIIVPVVNPDGFNISREAAPLGDFSLFDYEMKRKNCRISAVDAAAVPQPAPATTTRRAACAAPTRTATTADCGAAPARA